MLALSIGPMLVGLFVAASGVVAAQGGGGPQSVSTTPLSPSVLVTSVVSRPFDKPPFVQLLVLWRGAPGWFMKPGTHAESGGGDQTGRVGAHVERGGVSLDMSFDPATRTAEIGTKKVALGESNVILVDHVGDPGGPTIAGTARYNVDVPTSPFFQPVFATTPDLLAYLRCDMASPTGPPGLFDAICAQVEGRVPVRIAEQPPDRPVPWVTVTGLVQRPGQLPWRPRMTVGDAIGATGGMTPASEDREDSDLRSVITRIVDGRRVQLAERPTRETPLMRGDTLKVGQDLR